MFPEPTAKGDLPPHCGGRNEAPHLTQPGAVCSGAALPTRPRPFSGCRETRERDSRPQSRPRGRGASQEVLGRRPALPRLPFRLSTSTSGTPGADTGLTVQSDQPPAGLCAQRQRGERENGGALRCRAPQEPVRCPSGCCQLGAREAGVAHPRPTPHPLDPEHSRPQPRMLSREPRHAGVQPRAGPRRCSAPQHRNEGPRQGRGGRG